MNEPAPMSTPPQKTDMRTMALVVYGCWVGGFLLSFTGLGWLVGLASPIIAFIKKAEAAGTIYESHFEWVIRTFVVGVVGMLISIPLAFFGIGLVLMFALAVWGLYRLIKGGLRLHENRPIEAPKAWF